MPDEEFDKHWWNIISLGFDSEVAGCRDQKGRHLIPLFLDTLLIESCSDDVRQSFRKALVWGFREEAKMREEECEKTR